MSKIIDFFKRTFDFIRLDIWRITEHELTNSKKIAYRFVKIFILAIRGYISERLSIKASALTYSILFAIVPTFALFVAIGRGFGVETLIEESLKDSFFAQTNMLPMVMGMVGRYLETTQGGLFIGIGIIILIISVMNFFIQMEYAFNSIWQVKKSRSVINQFTMYFSGLVIIPILIVFSSGFNIYIHTVISKTIFYDLLSSFVKLGVQLSPYVINWIIFTIMYMVIPNTKVKFINALIAGIIAGTAFQGFQSLYISGQVYLSRYNVVYGSFAAIPLLLLWLQISCQIVLLGAEISYASQNIKNYDFEMDSKNISNRYKNFLTLFITYIVIKQFELQKPALSSAEITSTYKLPLRLTNNILSKLVESSILIEVFCENNKDKTYQPAIDIHQLTVKLFFEKIDSHGAELFLSSKNHELDSFWQKMLHLQECGTKGSEHILIKDL